MAENSKKRWSGRYRNWATIVYPESAPENWKEILAEHHIDYAISPIHDRDLDADCNQKKSHYHVMVDFNTVQSPEKVTEIFQSFGGVGLEKISSKRAYARYLCHLDNADKAQYDLAGVISCGIDYLDLISAPSDKYKYIGEMMDFCVEYNIVSYRELCDYARLHNDGWWRALCDNSSWQMLEYVKSLAWEQSIKEK